MCFCTYTKMNKQKDIEENEKEIVRVKALIKVNKEVRHDLKLKKWLVEYYVKQPEAFIKAPPEFTILDEESLTRVEDHIARLEDFLTDLEEYYWVIEAKDDY